MRKIIFLFDKLDRSFFAVAQLSIFLMMLVITAEAAMRYTGFSLPGTHIIIETYLMTVLTFFSMSYVMKMGGHIKLDFFIHRFPKRLIEVLDIIYCLLAAVIIFIIAYTAMNTTIDAYVNGYYSQGAIPWPTWTRWIGVSIGSYLFTIRLVLLAVEKTFLKQGENGPKSMNGSAINE